jgi:hypothetical protein
MDSYERFADPDIDRQLDTAAADLSRVKPLILPATLALVADESFYAAPADLLNPVSLDWGMPELACRNPWDTDYPGRLPRISALTVSGARQLMLAPPPTQRQIDICGSAAAYRYSAAYRISLDAADTNVPETARHLLLIRALAEAMQDLASRGVAKPVTLGGKAGLSVPKNGAPSHLADELLKRFEAMAA